MEMAYFRTLARYNRWANKRLLRSCAKLGHEEYFKPRQAFFKSIHGTLNHILLVDRIWIGRLTAKPAPSLPLDQILYGDFLGLKVARTAEDGVIVNAVGNLADADLARTVTFTRSNGEKRTLRTDLLLGHLFNHATHHRGQVHDMISQTKLPPPPLDLFIYLL
jgi:uncharacterized damage-inducible protein DinB